MPNVELELRTVRLRVPSLYQLSQPGAPKLILAIFYRKLTFLSTVFVVLFHLRAVHPVFQLYQGAEAILAQ